MSTKSKELCNTESENTALLGENSDKKEREKEKESESDILILNEPCEIIYSPEREEKEREKIESKPSNQLVKSPSHKGKWHNLEVDLEIEKIVSLTPVKEHALPNTPGKNIFSNETQDLRSIIESKHITPKHIQVTITQTSKTISAIKTHTQQSIQLTDNSAKHNNTRKTRTQPTIEYTENSAKHRKKSLSSLSKNTKHSLDSHRIHSHKTKANSSIQAFSHSQSINNATASSNSYTHAFSHSHSIHNSAAQANSYTRTLANLHSIHNPTAQPYTHASNDSQQHAYTQSLQSAYPDTLQHTYTPYEYTQSIQAYDQYVHPFEAHNQYIYTPQPITRTLTQVVDSKSNRPIIKKRERQNTRVISLQNKNVPDGMHLAIAVRKNKFYSKNALKKITRKLANEFEQ